MAEAILMIVVGLVASVMIVVSFVCLKLLIEEVSLLIKWPMLWTNAASLAIFTICLILMILMFGGAAVLIRAIVMAF